MVDEKEKSARLLHALLIPGALEAMENRTPLAALKKAVEMAYFHVASGEEELLKDLQEIMGVSISKVGLLSRHWRTHFLNALETHEDMTLAERVVYLLDSGPLTLSRLNQVMPEERYLELEDVLDSLLEQERIEKVEQQVTTAYRLLPQQDDVWDAFRTRIKTIANVAQTFTRAARQTVEDEEDTSLRHLELHIAPEQQEEADRILEDAYLALQALSSEPSEDRRTFEVALISASAPDSE